MASDSRSRDHVGSIRRMGEEDADAVRDVEAEAFYAWAQGLGQVDPRRYRRTRANVLACWEKDPLGCFVAEEEDQVVGFILSRTWGGAGWLGTFAVLPAYQGRGIGKALIAAGLDYLRKEPHRVIGLETMPDSPYNLGLYLRLGFEARPPTMLLGKALGEPAAEGPRLSHWPEADGATQRRWLSELGHASGQILPGLDFGKEVVSMAQRGVGETLVLTRAGRAVGLSVVRLASKIEDWGAEDAAVRLLALHPKVTDEDTLHLLLRATEALARSHGKKMLHLALNAGHAWALEQVLRWGYRVERMAVRMVLRGTDNGPRRDGFVDCSRWAA